jgi:acetolactate synthase-1/2/3 large subunit
MMGKGAFPENHPLYAWHAGSKGTTCGNKLAASADVLLAVGCRFADEATCSYRAGISFSIPPTRLVHADIDPGEIGKNYPVEVGIISDAYSFLSALLKALKDLGDPRDWNNSAYTTEILKLKENWFTQIAPLAESDQLPMTISRALREIRACLPDETIVVTSSGHTQAQVFQEFPFLLPRTNITTGGFSTMGWAVPAALGCKLGSPGQPVVAMVGDGDFLMSMHELATAKQYNIPILVIILNNYGWHSIKDLQIDAYGPEQEYVTRFLDLQGHPYSPNFAEVGRAFGVHALRVERPAEIQPAVKKALQQGGPAIVEVIVAQDHSRSGGVVAGWWDVPVPTYFTERRTAYERSRDEEIL